jgi:hypothetical protein
MATRNRRRTPWQEKEAEGAIRRRNRDGWNGWNSGNGAGWDRGNSASDTITKRPNSTGGEGFFRSEADGITSLGNRFPKRIGKVIPSLFQKFT